MGSFTQLAALALSLLAFHVSPSASAPAIPRGATSTDGSGDDTHALLSYPIIIPSPSLWEPFESFMASHVGLTAAYVFNETAQQEHLDLERRQREQKNELLGLSPPQHGTNISKRWGLECLSVNRAPSAERILEGNLPSPESGEGAAALCTSVDNRGRRTNVFLITGGPAAASPRPASSYARDVLTGFDAILESCEFCPEEKMVDGKSSCVVGGTNAAAGNGALGIWLIGEIPDGASAE